MSVTIENAILVTLPMVREVINTYMMSGSGVITRWPPPGAKLPRGHNPSSCKKVQNRRNVSNNKNKNTTDAGNMSIKLISVYSRHLANRQRPASSSRNSRHFRHFPHRTINMADVDDFRLSSLIKF